MIGRFSFKPDRPHTLSLTPIFLPSHRSLVCWLRGLALALIVAPGVNAQTPLQQTPLQQPPAEIVFSVDEFAVSGANPLSDEETRIALRESRDKSAPCTA